MKVRGLLLAICAVSAVMRAEEPDWFDAFRGRAFLQGDASFVARDKSASADTPPLFRARWVVLRYAAFTEEWRRFWPSRNLLLVTMPSGARYVLESSRGYADERHLEEERPWQRVASNRTAFEVWALGWTPGYDPSSPDAADTPPCEGMRLRLRAPGGTLEYFRDDFGSRTVRASLVEIGAATFDEDERRDLAVLLKISVDRKLAIGTGMPVYHLHDPLLAVNIALGDRTLSPEKRTVVVAPDPAAPADLSSWRALAHLPLDLPPFPPLPPEAPVR